MDWRGNKLCQNGFSHFCNNFLFSEVKVPQGWMAGCSAREADELVLALYAKIEDSRRGGQKGYLGEGDCSVNKDEIHKLEVQPEQQHKVNLPEYDEMCIILCFRLCVLYLTNILLILFLNIHRGH
jgi:hypothetical protein